MQIKSVGFSNLPFSELFKTYISNYAHLASFYNGNPFDEEEFTGQAVNYFYRGNRKELAEILRKFNSRFKPDSSALANIDRIEKEAITLVTGQQLGVYGGPLFTVFKIVTTILLAEKLEKASGRAVVPVFWLADEDHDYDEVADIVVPNRDDTIHKTLQGNFAQPKAVADLILPEVYDAFRNEVKELLPETAFSDDLWNILDDCYQSGSTFKSAFGSLISRIFSKHGLVLAGSNDKEVKSYLKTDLIKAIDNVDRIGGVLETQSAEIATQFHQQASTDESLLFLLDDKQGRVRIHHNDGHWSAPDGKGWSTEELKKLVYEHPEQFSPNVFLRPILQDILLPNIGYIAGPGELAYFGQMKSLYETFEVNMPFIIPRMSATIIESPVERVMRDLPFQFYEYNQRIEDLEKQFVELANSRDVNAIFNEWKRESGQLAESKIELISDIDASLEGTVKKIMASHVNELDKLRGKVFRSIKERNDIQIKRIHKIHTNLFPERSLQERVVSFIYYMNKYGVSVWDELIEHSTDIKLDTHNLIYI